MAVPIRPNVPKTFPAFTVILECERCGEKKPTVSIYAPGERAKQQPGFYPSRSFRLCKDCLEEAIAACPS